MKPALRSKGSGSSKKQGQENLLINFPWHQKSWYEQPVYAWNVGVSAAFKQQSRAPGVKLGREYFLARKASCSLATRKVSVRFLPSFKMEGRAPLSSWCVISIPMEPITRTGGRVLQIETNVTNPRPNRARFLPSLEPTTEVFPKSEDRDEPSAVQDWLSVKSSTALFPLVFGELSVCR